MEIVGAAAILRGGAHRRRRARRTRAALADAGRREPRCRARRRAGGARPRAARRRGRGAQPRACRRARPAAPASSTSRPGRWRPSASSSPGAAASTRRRSSRSPGSSVSPGAADRLLTGGRGPGAPRRRAPAAARSRRRPSATADRRVRNILSVVMQRLAASHAVETTVSVVQLPSDDMKGRIIGREGRNIRALENLTGVDFIIDDTPERRHPVRLRRRAPRDRPHDARAAAPGRPHPSGADRGDLLPGQVRARRAHRRGRGAGRASRPTSRASTPSSSSSLGRLKFRTSYGQNVLAHSVECAHLAAMMADELGASAKTARRAALLHDIGKAVSHEVEGPHALVGGDLARRHGESEAVAHAMEAHHNEVEPQTVEAVIVQTADALSRRAAGRARRVARALRQAAARARADRPRHDGVDKVYAMQAGREIRVIVAPGRRRRRRRARCSPARSPARSSRSSSTRARSRSPSSGSRARSSTRADAVLRQRPASRKGR